MPLNFCTIASGSSGNSAFVATDKTKILIDAGLSGVGIEKGLASFGVGCKELDAIFITHEHIDHLRGAGILSRRFDLPVYLTRGTWNYCLSTGVLGEIAERNRLFVTPDVPIVLNDLTIKPFLVPHDAGEPVGYTVSAMGYKVAVATDLGHVSQGVAENVYGADIVLFESNYDVEMLKNGPYPPHLKRRILSDRGHLSNVSCGTFLKEIFSERTKHIMLAHLSIENNLPGLAYETVKDILCAGKIDVGGGVGLYLAHRHRPGVMLGLGG